MSRWWWWTRNQEPQDDVREAPRIVFEHDATRDVDKLKDAFGGLSDVTSTPTVRIGSDELAEIIADAVCRGIARAFAFQPPPTGLTLIHKNESTEEG